MQEAKFSFNIKFRLGGFDCQFTLREDENGGVLIKKGQAVIDSLLAQGAVPNGFGSPPPKEKPARPVCPVCGRDDQLELIPLRKQPGKKLWKCQRCNKWLPGNGGA